MILAGGKSSRIGLPKAFLEINGKRIIDNTLEIFESIFDETFIITEDLIENCGPLGGIYTGLNIISFQKAFFVACDMPFLHTVLINRLLEAAKDETLDCIIPVSDKGFEPLHAVYFKKIIPAIEKSLEKKELSIIKAVSGLNCKYIRAGKDELSSFFNINTAQDLENGNRYIKNR